MEWCCENSWAGLDRGENKWKGVSLNNASRPRKDARSSYKLADKDRSIVDLPSPSTPSTMPLPPGQAIVDLWILQSLLLIQKLMLKSIIIGCLVSESTSKNRTDIRRLFVHGIDHSGSLPSRFLMYSRNILREISWPRTAHFHLRYQRNGWKSKSVQNSRASC